MTHEEYTDYIKRIENGDRNAVVDEITARFNGWFDFIGRLDIDGMFHTTECFLGNKYELLKTLMIIRENRSK